MVIEPTHQSTEDREAQRDEMTAIHSRFCRGLGDPKRLLIIVALQNGEQSVGQLAQYLGASHSNVSQHLALLRDLGLAQARRVDNNVYYRLADPRIADIVNLLRAIHADSQRSTAPSPAPTRSADIRVVLHCSQEG